MTGLAMYGHQTGAAAQPHNRIARPLSSGTAAEVPPTVRSKGLMLQRVRAWRIAWLFLVCLALGTLGLYQTRVVQWIVERAPPVMDAMNARPLIAKTGMAHGTVVPSAPVSRLTNGTAVEAVTALQTTAGLPPVTRSSNSTMTPDKAGKPWPVLHGYPPWDWPTSNTASCESAWGHGYSEMVPIYGDPPSGRFRFGEDAPVTADTSAWGSVGQLFRPQKKGKNWKAKPLRTGRMGSEVEAGEQHDDSWMRCLHNPTLRTSICEGRNIIFHPNRVEMSQGREEVASVMGRQEDEEYPKLAPGAFEVLGRNGRRSGNASYTGLVDSEVASKLFPPEPNADGKSWQPMLTGLQEASTVQCSTVFETTRLMVVRFEYVNVYHTTTDWHQAFTASRVMGLPHRPGVVFLDGHAKGSLDEVWEVLYDGVDWAKHLEGPVCFRHLVFVPVGYTSPIFQTHKGWLQGQHGCTGGFPQSPGQPNEEGEKMADDSGTQVTPVGDRSSENAGTGATGEPPKGGQGMYMEDTQTTPRSIEFAETFIRSFGVGEGGPSFRSLFERVAGARAGSTGSDSRPRVMRVLLARREFVIAHPRNKVGLQTRVTNEEEVAKALKRWASNWGRKMGTGINAGVPDDEATEAEEQRTRDPHGWAVAVRGNGMSLVERNRLNSSEDSTSQVHIRLRHARRTLKETEGESKVTRSERKLTQSLHNTRRDLAEGHRIYIVNGRLAHWKFFEQVEAAYWADVWVGAHGAGLTHLQFSRPGSHVIELRPMGQGNQYELLSQFRGLRYHLIDVDLQVDSKELVSKLNMIAHEFFGS